MLEAFLRKSWQTTFPRDLGMLKMNILFAKLNFDFLVPKLLKTKMATMGNLKRP